MARRRGSRRRKKHCGWGRKLGGAFACLLILAVVGLLAVGVWLRGYLRSPEFLVGVNKQVGEYLKVDVDISEFVWEGMHVRVPVAEVSDDDSMLRRVEAEEFETELKLWALMRKKFRSSDFVGRNMRIELDATKPAPVLPPPTGAFEFPGLRIESVDGEVDFGGSLMEWAGVRVDVQPGSATRSYNIGMTKGMVKTPIKLFPEGKLRLARARYYDKQLYLTEAEFGVYESGRLNLTGEVGFAGGGYLFEGALRRVMCAEMVPEDWKKRLLGRIESDFTVHGGGGKSPVVQGDISLQEGVLTALPVLDRLAAYTDTTRFRRLVLSEARLDFRQEGKRLELSDIVLASAGLVRLEGRLDIVDGRLDGVFQFGVAPGTMARIPGAETKVFVPGKEGLLWTPLRVTGTLEDPQEDLSERMIAAAKERMFELLPQTGALVLKNSGRVASDLAKGVLEKSGGLGKLGGGVIEQGADALDKGTDVLQKGTDVVGGLFDLIPGSRREEPRQEEGPEEEVEPEGGEEPEE